jgi:hypothetical protein
MRKLSALATVAAVALVLQAGPADAQNTAVGSAKCKMCHKVEFDSWAKTKHATAEPKAECETCHGNGSAYMKLGAAKGKDPAKAKAAGLTAKPEKASCTAKCHKPAEFKDDMLGKVHDKKVKK